MAQVLSQLSAHNMTQKIIADEDDHLVKLGLTNVKPMLVVHKLI